MKIYDIRTNLIFGYSAVFLLMLSVSVIAYNSIKSMVDTSAWVTHTQKVISTANEIMGSMVDMETGKRGYLITGVEEYLEPFDAGVIEFDKLIDQAALLTSDNEVQVKRWATIKSIKEKWIQESANPEIKLRREVNSGESAILEFKAISSRTLGKEIFDKIRKKLTDLEIKYNNNNNNNNNIDKNFKYQLTATTLALINMETGQRGFLLSGKEISLEPYYQGEKDLSRQLGLLFDNSSNTLLTKEEITEVITLVNNWKTQVADVEIGARRLINKYKYSTDDISKVLRKGTGKHYIDLTRLQIDKIISTEQNLMNIRASEQNSTSNFAINFTLYGTAAALLVGLIIAITISRNIFKSIQESQKKDQLLLQQSKLAAMGEMVGAIAHQWRQPLNALALSNQFIIDDYEDKIIDKEYIEEFSTSSMKLINFMSKTIDDFRNFFRVDKIEKVFSVHEKITDTSNMLMSQLSDHFVELKVDNNDFYVRGHDSEFQQVILNLINNAKDALLDHDISSPYIHVKVTQDKEMGIITIQDNAGGVPKDVIERIFEPYFTTKEEGKGTGLGLYMSKMIIVDNMGGELEVKNVDDGALFTIRLNLSKDEVMV